MSALLLNGLAATPNHVRGKISWSSRQLEIFPRHARFFAVSAFEGEVNLPSAATERPSTRSESSARVVSTNSMISPVGIAALVTNESRITDDVKILSLIQLPMSADIGGGLPVFGGQTISSRKALSNAKSYINEFYLPQRDGDRNQG
jgi:hypothetical protein